MMKRIAQALGFAAILLLPSYVDLTSSLGDEWMHVPRPLTRIALAQLVDLAIVALLFSGLIAVLRRRKSWPKIRWALLAVLPVYLLLRNLNLIPFNVPLAAVLALSIAWFIALALLIFRAPVFAVRLYNIGSAVLAGFAVFGLVVSWQLVRAAMWRPGPQAFSSSIPVQPPARPRIIWILFDELAYKPVFEARDPSLELPNFDRLRSQSTLYTQVDPIGYRTQLVVPGLLLGRIVSSAAYSDNNHYLIGTIDSPHPQNFDVNASLFGMAKEKDVTTSITGWYITYCPVFSGTATECYWSNDDSDVGAPPSLNASFAVNLWFPLRVLAEQSLAPSKASADIARWKSEGHIESVKDISSHALQTLAASQADLIYVHLPVPHPPAFWNRRTGSFASGGSYLDSLDYSDRLLGRILATLQSQQRWAATTLIVQGDHSWRTQMWRPIPGWSAEDERVSHGGEWDPRPLLLIHAAGQQKPEIVTAPTSLMFVHDYIAGQIQVLAK